MMPSATYQPQHQPLNWRAQSLICCHKIIFLYCLLACILPAFAQNPAVADSKATPIAWSQLADTMFSHLNTAHGLPHLVATSLVQDAQGFMWIGTQGGLARWDGYRAKVFLPDAHDPHSMASGSIQILHLDRRGKLWVGTSDAGLVSYDQQQERFDRVSLGSRASVMSLADDADDSLWVGTDEGLYHIAADGRLLGRIRSKDAQGRATALPHDFVRALLRDSDGRLWLGTRAGLVRREVNGQFTPIAVPTINNIAANVLSLTQSRDGRIWIGTSRQGAYVLPKNARQAERIVLADAGHSNADSAASLINDSISFITETGFGEIWFGTYGKGIVRLTIAEQAQKQYARRILHDASVANSLVNDWALAAYRDQSGQIWVATRGGISRHDPNQRAMLNLFGNNTRKGKIIDPDIFAVSAMPDGKIWLGLGVQGTNVIKPEQGEIASVKASQPEFHSVRAIAKGPDGNMFFATSDGLYRSQHYTEANSMQKIPGRQFELRIFTMLEDGNRIWLGSTDGLWLFDPSAEPELALSRVPGCEVLNQQVVTALRFAKDGKLWIGTRSKGLFRFDPKQRSMLNFVAGPEPSISSNIISNLFFDDQQRLWVPTQGGGLNLLPHPGRENGHRFIRVGVQQKLSNSLVNSVLQDDQGRIWASTDDGIWLIHPQSLAVRVLKTADGVAFPTYLGNSAAKTAYGELLFGGNGGLTVVRPALYADWRYQPPLVISDIKLGGKQVAAGRFQSNQAPGPALTVVADANSIAVEFAALDFTAPEQNRYAYQLKGYDKDWLETDPSRRTASYTNLPPGNYRLHLRASNRAGVWTEKELVLPIQVQAAWYQTWWFRLFLIGAGLFAVFTLVQWRTRYLRLRESQLDALVQKRTGQLQQKQTELLDANQALNVSNANLALSVETLRQLGDIGRELTANLNADIVFEVLYQHLGQLLDSKTLVIYRKNAHHKSLELAFGRDEGRCITLSRIALDDPRSIIAQVARCRQEKVMALNEDALTSSHVADTPLMHSALFAPMILDDRVLGVLSIQSPRPQAYGEREQLIFRTLLAYVSIALANADAITALTQAQGQLVQQEKMASLGGLVAGVAHEINTPLGNALVALSGLSGVWQQLQASFQAGRVSTSQLRSLSEEGNDYLQLALRTAGRAADLVTSFKAIASSFDSDHASDVDLSTYLPDMAHLVWGPFHQHERQLQIEVAAGLQLHVVQEALTEALTRILANVQDHALPHQKCQAKLRAYALDESEIVFEVSDNGPGIAPTDLGKVFDPFFTTKPGAGGHVGLGLHVAYNHVIQRLHGKIEISSVLGEGTVVKIIIPRGVDSITAVD